MRERPGCQRLARRAFRDDLPDVPKPPELRESRIVRLTRRIHDVVRLDVQDVVASREAGNERLNVLAAGPDTPQAASANRCVGVRVDLGADTGEIGNFAERDEHFPRDDRAAAEPFGGGAILRGRDPERHAGRRDQRDRERANGCDA